MRVYAGDDPVTGRRVYHNETVRGTDRAAEKRAQKVLTLHLASASEDEDLHRVDQGGRSQRAAAELAEDLSALEHRVRVLAGSALGGVGGVDLALAAGQSSAPAGVGIVAAPLLRRCCGRAKPGPAPR